MLNENDYAMGEEMPNAAHERADAPVHKQGRQVAGRDFVHESRCLHCWTVRCLAPLLDGTLWGSTAERYVA